MFVSKRQIRNKKNNSFAAAKIFRKDELKAGGKYRGDPNGRDLVERELRLLAELDHPNIMKVSEAYEDQFKIYFIIEEFRGGTLFDRIIDKGQLDDENAATIGAFLISILKYCEKNNVIIRNLKPEVIVLEDKDSLDIRLIDLSLAIKQENYKEGAPDPLYDEYSRMPAVFKAPELHPHKKKYTNSCDVWSAGCIIFNMVTGIPPFYESDSSALQNLIMHGEYNGYFPEFDKKSSPELKALVEGMIRVKP